MKTFTLNGKLRTAKPIGFNMICELEEQGISLEKIEKMPMCMIRTYIASCLNTTVEDAGVEIENHMINGGSLDELATVLSEAMNDSGFFRSLDKAEEESPTTRKSKKKGEVVAITQA